MWWIIGVVVALVAVFALWYINRDPKPSVPEIPEEPDLVVPTDWEDAAYLFHFKDMKPPIAESDYATNPLKHWYDWGQAAGWKWKPDNWSSAQYLLNNTDVASNPKYGSAPLLHYWEWGQEEGRSFLKILPEITSFVRLSECDNPLSMYFGVNKINGKMVFGTYGYQHGDHSSEIYEYPHTKVAEFDCESVMQIEKHAGKYYCTLEHGKIKSGVDKAMIMRLDGSVWNEVYRSDHAVLAIGLKSHSDGYIYATIPGSDSPNSDIVRSQSGDSGTWEKWYTNTNEYRFFGISSWGGNILVGASSSLGDWGGNTQPSIFVNKNLVFRDADRTGDGFWGAVSFNGEGYVGGTGRARVVRVSDKKTVLDKPDFQTVFCFVVDKMRNTLFALVNPDGDVHSSGSEIWATKDGNNWYNVGGPLSAVCLMGAYYDSETGDVWLVGGRFAQGSNSNLGYGRIFKGVRG
jgi:hypothetical protein